MPGVTAPSVILSTDQIGAGVIVNADINAAAAIEESKIAFATNDGSRHDHHAADIAAGTLSVTRGGTGVSDPTTGNLLVGAGASAMTALAGTAAGQVVGWNGSAWIASAAPASLVLSSIADVNHTGNTSETTLFSGTLPGGSMDINGMVRIRVVWNAANDGGGAGNQTLRIKFGGTEFASHQRSSTSGGQPQISEVVIGNDASASVQQGSNTWWKNDGATSGIQFSTETAGAINTASDVTILVSGQLSNSAHHIEINSIHVECFKKA